MQRFKIIKITDKNGEDRVDGRYPLRIGRKCEINMDNIYLSYPLVIQYSPDPDEDYLGVLTTSGVQDYIVKDGILTVTTRNSIYNFEIIS